MKWKMVFHAKFLSIFVILLLSGIAITPSINAIKITKNSVNISDIEIDKSLNSLDDKSPSDFPDGLCDCLLVIFGTYGLMIMIPLMMLYEEGLLTTEQVVTFAAILAAPVYPFIFIYMFLNCTPPDIWWNDPFFVE